MATPTTTTTIRSITNTDNNNPHSNLIIFHHLKHTESTQDAARQWIDANIDTAWKEKDDDLKFLAVMAEEQSKGRGTSGRKWMGMRGNLFLTIAMPMKSIPTKTIPLTMLPLQVGVLVAERVDKFIKSTTLCQQQSSSSSSATNNNNENQNRVTVKWPNDVLVNEEKISGILIESHIVPDNHDVWFLIGVGINIVGAPNVPSQGPDRGRSATCLQRLCQVDDSIAFPTETAARVLGHDLAIAFVDWVKSTTQQQDDFSSATAATVVIENWKKWSTLGEKLIRIRETNELVMPLDLIPDGRLLVRGEDGKERLLVTEYSF